MINSVRLLQKQLLSSLKVFKSLNLAFINYLLTQLSVINVYFFTKSLINLSRNSVKFENSSENWLSDYLNSVRFYLTM